MLSRIVQRPKSAYAGCLVLVLAGVLVVLNLGQSLFPTFKERDFLMHFLTAPGTSVAEEARMITQFSKDLRAIPGVQTFGSHIGQAFLGEEVAGVNFGENWISIDENADYDETIAKIQEVVDSYPGVYRDLLTYLNERIEEVLTGAKEPIVVRVYGEDLQTIRDKAHEIERKLAGIEGITDDHVDLQVDEPQIEVEVDLPKAADVRPETRRRAPGCGHPGRRRGGRRHLPGRQGLRHRGVEHPGDPEQRGSHRQPAHRHAVRPDRQTVRRRRRW